MKKQLLLFVMTLLPMVANAADVVIDGIYYNLSKSEKVAVVTYRDDKYKSYSGDVAIPTSFIYGGIEYRVTKIGSSAFRDCSNLTSVDIPESVTVISSGAFQNCNSLNSVTIPNSVTSISNDAFNNCSGLTSVTIPNSVTYLGQNAFRSCSSLTSLTIGNGLSEIGESAFQYCYSLTTVTIPNNITHIRPYAFHYCSNLASVTIGSGVKSIADKAFATCPELAVVYCFPKEVPRSPSYGSNSEMFNKSNIGKATLYVPTSLIDQYKAQIPWYGFGTIASLDCIDGIYYNFNDNDEAEVTYLDESYNSYSGEVVIPTSVTSVWGKTYSVTGIGEYAFKGCRNLTAVTIPNSVKNIGAAAFDDCKELSSISLPEYLSNIGNVAFRDCCSLSSVTIPSSVTTINVGTFYRCANLISITIPSSVKSIRNSAFQDCKSLADVYCLPESVPQTNSTAFDNTPIKSATLHIPNMSIHLYKNTSLWGDFGNFAGLYGNAYTLLYTIDGSEYKSYKVWEDEKITPEDVPTKEGYTFSGWSEIPESMPAHDVTVTGSFSINSYQLTYMVDGEEYKSYQIDYGTSITAEAMPTKIGYTFSGWSEIPKTMPAHDVTVTGTFSVNSYSLTYVVDDELYKTYEVEYGTEIIPEEAPQKTGYTFSGWSDIPSTMPAKDVTISGTFTINNYKLTYIVDGAEYKTVEVEYNSVIMPEAEPTKEGYTFSGWSEIPETMPAHDVTVTGKFTINKYKLTYTVDGEEYKSYEVEYGATITPEAAPTKEGFTFSGWSEIPETMPAHDVTVTGTFSINKYKLTYTVDGAEYKTYEVEYGATITAEAAPTKEGYIFNGWSEIPQMMPAYDVTVTGTFSINKYKLTYTVDGAEYKTYEVEYGATITAEADPTKEGYTFSGWSEIPETMPAHDVMVNGMFSINKYKFTYTVDGEEYKTYEVEYGSSITPEAEPTKEGYTFSGWSEIPQTMPAHDVTVTGTFNVNSYKLTYMIDDKVYKETMYEYGATITPEPQPEGDYATFEWTDLPQAMPAHDVVVYASYTSGIIEVLMASQHNVRIYSPNGKKLNKLQKGLNIVILCDGTIKKVIMK